MFRGENRPDVNSESAKYSVKYGIKLVGNMIPLYQGNCFHIASSSSTSREDLDLSHTHTHTYIDTYIHT